MTRPAGGALPFRDVPADHWARVDIGAFWEAGMRACAADASDAYCPDRPITRAELAVMLRRALGLGQEGGQHTH